MKKLVFALWGMLLTVSALCNAQTPQTEIDVTFYTPGIVRVTKTTAQSPALRQSLSVTMSPEDIKVSETGRSGVRTYKSSALTVRVSDDRIFFLDSKGKVLLAESPEYSIGSAEAKNSAPEDMEVSQGFLLDSDEPIYGLGILQEGRMDMRGTDRRMIQGNTDDYCNIIQSIKGYGLFWDNYSPTTFKSGSEGFSFSSENGGYMDYYFIYGQDADGVIAGIRRLTGTVPMMPLWSYGFMQSRERYTSSAELLDVLERYRATGVPIDCMIQDWQYWGNNYLWNAMEFNAPEFSDPERWIGRIHEQNAKLMISIWSSFGPMTKQYRELQPKGLLIDFQTWPQSGLTEWPPRLDYPSGVRPYDPFSKEARDIYWNHLTRLRDFDIDGWWMDSTEPDHIDFTESDLDLPTAMGPFRRVRNAFPLMAVGGVYDNQRQVENNKRVVILTRSVFAGQQRYGSNTWSGDVQSNWESLRRQVPAGLNFALTGNPNFNSDLGGFFANSYNEPSQFGSATQNPLYQELYVRWMQYGVFSPMMRSHGTEVPRELYYYGEPGQPVYDALLDAVKLRYTLLPYIYSLAHEVNAHNGSFQRALMMDFRNDRKVWDINDEFMFGRSILVAPVLEAQYTSEKVTSWSMSGLSGVDFTQPKETRLYLPAGTQWYDWYTNELLKGGAEYTRETSIGRIPAFVKAGSILPIGPDVQYSTEKPWDELEIRVYAGQNGTFTLYEDEFDGYNYEKGACSTIDFKWNDSSRTLTISTQQGHYEGMIGDRTFRIVFIDKKGAKSPRTVSYHGQKVSVRL